MTQDDLVEKSMEYFKSIAHTIGDQLTIADTMILVTRAYEAGYRHGYDEGWHEGYADGVPTERAEDE